MTTRDHRTGTVELIDYLGYRIRLCRSPIDWVAFIARQGQHEKLVVSSDKESAVVAARHWIDDQLISRAHELTAGVPVLEE
jgi:hypothetical protein